MRIGDKVRYISEEYPWDIDLVVEIHQVIDGEGYLVQRTDMKGVYFYCDVDEVEVIGSENE